MSKTLWVLYQGLESHEIGCASRTSLAMRCPQVELYNDEMKDEILVTRRATYKAEESVSMLEKNKGSQDLFIDRLMDQVSFFSLRAPYLEKHSMMDVRLEHLTNF